MRAIVVTENGGPEVLELRDLEDPQPGAGQLLVDVEAVGVNFRDIYEREGIGGYSNETPFVAGAEGAGTVAEVGDGVTDFAPGDRVAWAAADGSYAERVLVPADGAVAVPDGVSTEIAAAAILQGMTAHYLAVDTYPVQSGDVVIVHAAAGGVGLLLTQIVKLPRRRRDRDDLDPREGRARQGRRRRPRPRLRRLLRRGARAVRRRGCRGRLRRRRPATFDGTLAALRPRGYMVAVRRGQRPGRPGRRHPAAPGRLAVPDAPGLPHYIATREELLQRAGDVFGWIADGSLDVRIGARYPLAEARQAQEDLAGRKTTGKVLLLPR